jgi:hypothetical protein
VPRRVSDPPPLVRVRTSQVVPTQVAPTTDATAAPEPAAPSTVPHVPRALASRMAELSSDARADFAKLWFVCGADRALKKAVSAVLMDDMNWTMTMTTADERRLLAKAMDAVPVPSTPSKRADRCRTVSIVREVTDGKRAVPNALETLRRAWANGDDVTMGPEWLLVPHGKLAWSEAEKDALVQRIAALTDGSDRLLTPGTIPWHDDEGRYHNTAYAISDGRVLLALDKRGDGDDVDIAQSAGLTFASDASASTFAWRGLRVGLEICRDHGDARMRFELLGQKPLDLHLVVSSGVWLKHANVGVGGACVVAQGDASFTPEAMVRGAEQNAHHEELAVRDGVCRIDLG